MFSVSPMGDDILFSYFSLGRNGSSPVPGRVGGRGDKICCLLSGIRTFFPVAKKDLGHALCLSRSGRHSPHPGILGGSVPVEFGAWKSFPNIILMDFYGDCYT